MFCEKIYLLQIKNVQCTQLLFILKHKLLIDLKYYYNW